MADTSLDGLSSLADTTQSLTSSLQGLDGLAQTFGRSLSTALKGAVVQGKSLDTVLRGLAERLTAKALEAALSPLTSLLTSGAGSILSGLTGALGFARGGVFASGAPIPFANGGVVAAPTYFPMSGGRVGLMGEAGAEAVMPLTRGADGRLGVVATGGEGGGSSVVFNVSTPDAASFRRSEVQLTSMLARAVGRGRRGL